MRWGPSRHAQRLDGLERGLRDVRARLVNVGPHVVQEVLQPRVLAAQALPTGGGGVGQAEGLPRARATRLQAQREVL